MSSKRKLVGGSPPSDDLWWPECQWNRITAFLVGAVATVVCLFDELSS